MFPIHAANFHIPHSTSSAHLDSSIVRLCGSASEHNLPRVSSNQITDLLYDKIQQYYDIKHDVNPIISSEEVGQEMTKGDVHYNSTL